MAGDRLVREIEGRSQLTHGGLAPSKAGDDRATSSVAKGSERCIQLCIDVGQAGHDTRPYLQCFPCARISLYARQDLNVEDNDRLG